MEIAEIELSTNLSRKLQHELVWDAIRKTLWKLKRNEVILAATSEPQTPRSQNPYFWYERQWDSDGHPPEAVPATAPLLSHQTETEVLTEHVRCFVFAIS